MGSVQGGTTRRRSDAPNTGWRLVAAIAATLGCCGGGDARAQTTFTFQGATGASWIRATNWTGGGTNKTPGVDANSSTISDGATTDIAAVSSNSSITGVGINFNTGAGDGVTGNGAAAQSLTLGAITFATGASAGAFTVGNNSTSLGGTLTLTGVAIDGTANAILRNSAASQLTIANTQGSGNKTMDLALGNATTNAVRIDDVGSIFVSSAITGTGRNLSKEGTGAGSLILAGTTANTFSGTTTINGGSISAQTAGSLGGTSGIAINNGGTLLLLVTTGSKVTNRINNSAGVTLSGGGAFRTNGLSEGTAPTAPIGGTAGAAGLGTLTLQGTTAGSRATLDFGAGANGSALVFAGLSGANGAYLDVLNWTGAALGDDGTSTNDRLLFAADPGLTRAQLANVTFSYDTGVVYAVGGLVIPYGNEYEIVPAPEPATLLGGGLIAVAMARRLRRRTRPYLDAS